jgi:hypothetical protein
LQEELVEEMNLEKNDEQDFHSMKEEFFKTLLMNQEFWKWSVIRRNHESILTLETPHPIKDNSILEQPRVDFIESWFQSIVGQSNAIIFSTHLGSFFL